MDRAVNESRDADQDDQADECLGSERQTSPRARVVGNTRPAWATLNDAGQHTTPQSPNLNKYQLTRLETMV
jgi:hypothetical protein